MRKLADVGRDYQRYDHSASETFQLAKKGFQTVQSSNVSAIGVEGEDLLIRFHNGSVYRYFFMGLEYMSIMMSVSKGKWVWRNLRRPGVPYEKVGAISLVDDLQITDEELFDLTDDYYYAEMTQFVGGQAVRQFVNTEYGKMEYMNIAGQELFRLL